MAEFDPQSMIISRGMVYNKTTGRWLGRAEEFAEVGPVATGGIVPHADDLSKSDLVAIAKRVELAGYSSMSKDELVTALAGMGAVDDTERPEADDGESGAESE
jgi:hypothetical protein